MTRFIPVRKYPCRISTPSRRPNRRVYVDETLVAILSKDYPILGALRVPPSPVRRRKFLSGTGYDFDHTSRPPVYGEVLSVDLEKGEKTLSQS